MRLGDQTRGLSGAHFCWIGLGLVVIGTVLALFAALNFNIFPDPLGRPASPFDFEPDEILLVTGVFVLGCVVVLFACNRVPRGSVR